MAYLMTDVAAGGQAALKLQQSMAAAPYVEQEAAATAEESQLKLQQERLKASYAPQMAAAKAEQEELLLKDQRRKELAAEVGYVADKESTDKLQQWMLTDEGKKASEADVIKKAAVFKLQAGLTEQGTKLMAQAERLDAVDIANQAKRLAADDEAITKASIAIDAVPEGREMEFISRLPADSIKAVEARVGKENWDAYTGPEKKQVLSRLMLNTKTLAAEQKRALDLKKTQLITEVRKDIAINHEDESTRRKELEVESKQTLQTEKLAAQKERQDADLEARQERQNKDLVAKQERLDKDLEAKEARLKLDLAAKETRLKEDLEARLERERLRGATSKEIEAMKDETKKTVEGMRDKTLKEIESSKETAAKEIERMKEKGKKELEGMKESFKKSLPAKEKDTTAKDFRGWSAYTKERDAIVKSTTKEEQALTDQIVKAEAKVLKAKDASWYEIGAPDLTKSTAAYDELVAKRDALRKDRATKELDLVSNMPDFPSKEKIVNNLQKQLKILPAETDDPKKQVPKDAKDVSAAKLAATSNKPAAQKFEEGKVYTDAKGNKAKYVNGKWEPQ
jgi:hypothetical protein